MPTTIIANDRGTRLTVENQPSDEWTIDVRQGATLRAAGAIVGTGGAVTVDVAGTVSGIRGTGILLGDAGGLDQSDAVYVQASGAVRGGVGIRFESFGATVFNKGLISGTQAGVVIGGQDAVEASTVKNFGTIEGERGIQIASGTTEEVIITNRGTIRETGAGRDAIVSEATGGLGMTLDNHGTVRGNVLMGGTDDVYVNHGGRVTGTIQGRGGNDTFLPGAGVERINGGAGLDTLDFGAGGGVRATIGGASGSNTGAARGDSYTGIERVLGSQFGNDHLTGSRTANTLDGQGGRDVLSGGRGSDQMIGGTGIDRLTGGAGNDSFVFRNLGERGDVVTDFSGAAGNDDRFLIAGAGFGGLAAGTLDPDLFHRGSTNAAADADDRFVFRTTDKTLWFDADGTGAGKAVLMADLQAGANVQAGDIFVF